MTQKEGFDEIAVHEAFNGVDYENKFNMNEFSFTEGARWQFEQSQALIEELEKKIQQRGARRACFEGATCELMECQICGCEIHLDEPEDIPVCEDCCYASPSAIESYDEQLKAKDHRIAELEKENEGLREALTVSIVELSRLNCDAPLTLTRQTGEVLIKVKALAKGGKGE